MSHAVPSINVGLAAMALMAKPLQVVQVVIAWVVVHMIDISAWRNALVVIPAVTAYGVTRKDNITKPPPCCAGQCQSASVGLLLVL